MEKSTPNLAEQLHKISSDVVDARKEPSQRREMIESTFNERVESITNGIIHSVKASAGCGYGGLLYKLVEKYGTDSKVFNTSAHKLEMEGFSVVLLKSSSKFGKMVYDYKITWNTECPIAHDWPPTLEDNYILVDKYTPYNEKKL